MPISSFQRRIFYLFLGKPSRRKVPSQPALLISSLMSLTMIFEGTSLPRRMDSAMSSACAPSLLTSCLSKSPVQIWLNPYFLAILAHCVPLPEPGFPRIHRKLILFLCGCFGKMPKVSIKPSNSLVTSSTV